MYASNAKKLHVAPLGSSQANEALNNTIGRKAPKIRHYGSSESNDFRVACAVGQKNLGHCYVSQVSRYNITSILILYTSQVVRCIEHYTLSNVFSVISPVPIANHTGKSQENKQKIHYIII